MVIYTHNVNLKKYVKSILEFIVLLFYDINSLSRNATLHHEELSLCILINRKLRNVPVILSEKFYKY